MADVRRPNADTTDPLAASIHRAKAEKHYADAERFRKLGMKTSERMALVAARSEDDTAYILSTGKEPRRV